MRCVLAALACTQSALPTIDPSIQAEVDTIKAIDDHAHPVRFVAAGQPADRLFDALPVDTATFEEPRQYPRGIDTVIVNGRVVLHEGKRTAERPGRPLTRSP